MPLVASSDVALACCYPVYTCIASDTYALCTQSIVVHLLQVGRLPWMFLVKQDSSWLGSTIVALISCCGENVQHNIYIVAQNQAINGKRCRVQKLGAHLPLGLYYINPFPDV